MDEYLETVEASQKAQLERVREIVKQAVPEAEEAISYGMPAFRYRKKYLIGFAAFKNHVSLFPTPGPIEAMRPKLEKFKLSKGTIQFTTGCPIPESIIRELVLLRLAEISGSSTDGR